MPEATGPQVSPAQVAILERVLQAGYTFTRIGKFERYLGVEKNRFVALLDLAGDRVRMFGQVGYLIGDGIGVLVERQGKQRFVWHAEEVEATAELLAAYRAVKEELKKLLEDAS
jgi:hypothetical protein